MHQPKRPVTIRKYLAIQKRHKYLYDVKRLRTDDVIKQLMKEFFIADQATIYRILATPVSDPADEPVTEIPLKNGGKATVQNMF